MAGDWMKVEKSTPDKPEVFAIADDLNIDPDAVFGKCFRVWGWFDSHTTNGKTNGTSVSKNLIDRLVGVKGFADSMVKVGWLFMDGDGVCATNFERHNGETAKQRALTAKRVAKHTNGKLTDDALPREEKRREDINTIVRNDVADDCPHQEIINLYHKHLPMMTQVKTWTAKRASALKSRWRESKRNQTLDFWERFFVYVSKSDFLTGRSGGWDKCDLEWLIKSENFVKVIEGKYENKDEVVA